MSVTVSPRTFAGAPALVALPDGARTPLPAVLWYHGYRADAAANRSELERIAGAGFVAVGVDAVGHGRRQTEDLAARSAATPGGALGVVLEVATATADEVPRVVDALVAEGLADPARVGLVGISMGGYLAYRSALVEPRLRAVVAVLGSPEWPGRADSPHLRPDDFRRLALLSITAERDESVPPDAARRFHSALAAAAGGHPAPERARYLELAGAPHLMSAEQWATAMDATLDWLVRHVQHS